MHATDSPRNAVQSTKKASASVLSESEDKNSEDDWPNANEARSNRRRVRVERPSEELCHWPETPRAGLGDKLSDGHRVRRTHRRKRNVQGMLGLVTIASESRTMSADVRAVIAVRDRRGDDCEAGKTCPELPKVTEGITASNAFG